MESKNLFEKYLESNIVSQIPIAYVEGYSKYRNEIDFYIHNYEGEVSFSKLIGRVYDSESIHSIKSDPPPGISCINSDFELVKGSDPRVIAQKTMGEDGNNGML